MTDHPTTADSPGEHTDLPSLIAALKARLGGSIDGDLAALLGELAAAAAAAAVGPPQTEAAVQAEFQAVVDEHHRMLRTLAHEVRNPLTAAQMLLDQLAGTDEAVTGHELDEAARKDAIDARSCVAEALNIVAGQLEMASLEHARRVEPRPAFTSVPDLLDGVSSVVGSRRADDDVQVLFACDPDLPLLTTDGYLLTQVLRNLVGNALKFTDAGTIAVRASLDADGDEVRVAVTDTGIGIAAADRERVFAEFAQVESAQRGRRHGTGLGLAISRDLVAAIGGRIELQSAVGVGSTFTVVLPVRQASATTEDASLPSPPRAVSSVGRAGDS